MSEHHPSGGGEAKSHSSHGSGGSGMAELFTGIPEHAANEVLPTKHIPEVFTDIAKFFPGAGKGKKSH